MNVESASLSIQEAELTCSDAVLLQFLLSRREFGVVGQEHSEADN